MKVLAFWFLAGTGILQAQWASEPGFAIVQRQCMKCHGKASIPQAVGVAALREFSGEKIYDYLTTQDSHDSRDH